MKRFILLVCAVGSVITAFESANGMRKLTPAEIQKRLTVAADTGLGKRQPTPSLTTAQQSAIGRRVSNLSAALERVHIVGSAQASFPPGLVDGIVDWRENNAADVEVWWDSETQTPFFIKGADLTLSNSNQLARRGMSSSANSALSTLDQIAGLIRLDDPSAELRIVSELTDDLGMIHVRLQQTFQGYDVWARSLAVHFDRHGKIASIAGRWAPTPVSLETTAILVSEAEADKTVRAWYQQADELKVDSIWSTVYVDADQEPHFTWAFRVSVSPTEAYDSFVDAVTSEFLHESPLVCSDGPVVGSGIDLTGTVRTVQAYEEGTTYYMIDFTKPMPGLIVIYNNNASSFVQSLNLNSWGNPAAVSASRHLGIVYDYFLNKHSRNSIDGNGGTLRAVVNYTPGPTRAFFSPGTQTMYFGAGDGSSLSNLAGGLDVAAHEMGHGVIENTAGLKYESASGALNESMADVFGCMAEFYSIGASGDWLLGEDVTTPGVAGDCLRNMADPGNVNVSTCCGGPQPTHMSQYANLPNTEVGDWGGVHVNSGIPNRAFYLVASSIGRDKADSIWYRALRLHLSPLSNFTDLRLTALQSASELYPGNNTIYNALITAFNTVGITDGTGALPPEDLPAPSSAQWIVSRDESSGRAALYDTSGVFMRFISTAQVISKPSTPDESDMIYFVDHTFNITAVNRAGTTETTLGSPSVDFNSVAVSPDGNHLAYFVQADPVLYQYDLAEGQNDPSLLLYSPTNASGGNLFDVVYPDVLEWTIDGSSVVFDCECILPIPGDTIHYWDIRTINVSTGVISRTLPTVAPGTQVGNPTLGKIHPDLLGFDYIRFDDSVFVNTANLSSNSFALISINGTSLGRPSFSPDDSRIVLQYDAGSGNNLWKIGYNAELNQSVGSFQAVAANASFANWRFEGRDIPAGIFDDDEIGTVPNDFVLDQNFPNPFNAGTTMSFTAGHYAEARLDVFNVLGQHVYQKDLGQIPPGRYSVTWNARDDNGADLASGVYFYRVSLGKSVQTRKMVLVK